MNDAALVRNHESAKTVLERLDWNFHPRPVSPNRQIFDCRRYHWYPATFIPEIPFTLIEVLTDPEAVVLDPFAGIGTTFFQAMLLGRIPHAVEISRIAIQYMRSILNLFDPDVSIKGVLEKTLIALESYDSSRDYASLLPPTVPYGELLAWFAPTTLNQLSFVLKLSESCSEPESSLLRASLSAILKAASRQKRGWGCIADNVRPKPYQIVQSDAVDLVRRHASRIVSGIRIARSDYPDYVSSYASVRGGSTIHHEDSRVLSSIPDESVDLVVTSPPYPYMCDYVNSQRLSYYMFGQCPTEGGTLPDFREEIGARRRRRIPDSLEVYFADLTRCNEAIAKKIKVGGLACFIMPFFDTDNTNNKQRRLIVYRVLADLEEHGLIRECELERTVPRQRRQHNSNWSTLERERIVVFRKV